MTYADITTGDPNPVKRWFQRRRFSDALSVVRNAENSHTDPIRILDFGAGNGELVRQMAQIAAIQPFVYEPAPILMAEAEKNLKKVESVTFLENLESAESESFDFIFCLEVFEHLPEKETADAIAEIHRLLKPDGQAIIGVPHELFLPALLKGAFRMSRRYGEFDAQPGNILAAFSGRPPARRPVAEISPGLSYHFYHLGFDFRMLEQQLVEQFSLAEKWFSPFPAFGAVLNSEVYYLLEKKDQ